jgi:hypothetical protein
MSSDAGILAIAGTLVGLIAIVLVIYRWYTSTTLYTDRRRR